MNLSSLSRTVLMTGAATFALCSGAMATAQEQTAQAQSEPTVIEDDDEDDVGGIIVSARRLRGQLDVGQAPILELSEEQIAAEGVASIGDLVTQISAQTGSSRGRGGGRPIILVNGIRPGSFRELFQYPPEALAKTEVFPEEVAQRFGFPPDRRVINLILKDNYRNAEVEFEFEGPSRGGNYTREQELGFLQIKDGARININLEANDTSFLTEDERDIIQTENSTSDVAGDPDQAPFRSLVSDSRSLEANISWAKAFQDSGTAVTANANYVRSDARRLQGLNTVLLSDGPEDDPATTSVLRTFGADSPIEQVVASDTFSVSGSVNTPVNSFRLTTTLDGSVSEQETRFDQEFDTSDLIAAARAGELALDAALPTRLETGFDVASSRTITAETLTTLRGPLAYLPGGELIATFDLGLDWDRIESDDTRTNLPSELTRRRLSTGANLNIPITSRREGFADALGSFTLNLQAGFEDLSDFGLLGDYTAGLTWAPFDNLDLTATYIYREVAPTLSALGDPQVVNFNLQVFDFVNNETVLADVTTGGNPDLVAETQRDWKFAANWELPFWEGTRFQVEYIRNRSDDVVSSFPQITPEIEAAFPGRITRDADGTLIALDRRQVSFAETKADRLNFSLNLRGSFGGSSERGGDRGGPPQGASRPANAAPAGAPSDGPPAGPPAGPMREGFAAFRSIICADDGADRIKALIARIEAGEDVSDTIPGFDPAMAQMMLSRLRSDNGEISDERLSTIRERMCSAEAGASGSGSQNSQTAGGRARGGPPGGFNPLARNGFSGFRYFVSLNHTIELANEITIAPGLAPLDQLDGQSTNFLGLPRHTSRLEAGIFGKGIGTRLSGRYTGKARLDGSTQTTTNTIFIDDLVTFDLRVFANLDQLTGGSSPALKNVRVSLRADNIFDAQQKVVDETGETPLTYQPFLIDPVGRFIGIDIRKLF
ncbi:hypothetical protein INR77_07340 [Erythrobacter sp. SCSIO 43205]|uniref:hypothetical protein n=1 Tax=Erythrobacter sp. SCSIO 43205 TaxID=2779361 RepID=UPI001CA810A5|nr:hypothetical protein [Erythrobacter sp. SCSIO 43205]UAB79466.1 hypothetical protein INR77_07340 [Erythrobacter sp. SCSIO 43205]